MSFCLKLIINHNKKWKALNIKLTQNKLIYKLKINQLFI